MGHPLRWTRALALGAAVLIAGALTPAASGPARPLGLDVDIALPEDKPLTAEKIQLGRRLFHDRRLSRSGGVTCASCHNPRPAFSSPQVRNW